jgi:hypothetical protein
MFRVVGRDARGKRREMSVFASTEAEARALAHGEGLVTIDRVSIPPPYSPHLLSPKVRAFGGSCLGGVLGGGAGVFLGVALGSAGGQDLFNMLNAFILAGIGGLIGAIGGAVVGAVLAARSTFKGRPAMPDVPVAKVADAVQPPQESTETELARLKERMAELEARRLRKDPP